MQQMPKHSLTSAQNVTYDETKEPTELTTKIGIIADFLSNFLMR